MNITANIHKPMPLRVRVGASGKWAALVVDCGGGGQIDVTIHRTREEIRAWMRDAQDAISAALVELAVQDALASRDAPANEAAAQAEAEAVGYATPAEAVAATADVEEPL